MRASVSGAGERAAQVCVVDAATGKAPKTVEFHLTRVYRKLGVRSRSELVRLMSRN